MTTRAPDAFVGETERAHLVGIQQVAPVHDHRASHALGRRGPVELAQLGPFGDDHRSVCAVERIECRLRDLDTVQVRLAVRNRVPCRDVRPLGEEPAREDEARRLTHVVGARLEREPEERDPLPTERSEPPLELPDDASLLQLVHLDDRVQELEVVARVRRELLERERVLREAGAAVPDSGAEERRADPAIEADGLGNGDDVRSSRFADVGDLVDEADARHQGGIRRELDHLRGRDVGAHDLRVDALVERGDDVRVGLVERADHDAIGLHEVTDRRAFGREFRIRGVADVCEPPVVEPVADGAACPDRNGALHREDDPAVDLRQLVHDRPDVREIGVARVRRRRSDRDVDDVRVRDRLADVGREAQALAVRREKLHEPGLVDRNPAVVEARRSSLRRCRARRPRARAPRSRRP